MSKVIQSKIVNTNEIEKDGKKVNALKSILTYEDGQGVRKKGYYITTSLALKTPDATFVYPCGIEKLIVDLKDKNNTRVVREDAEMMFETESDIIEKHYMDKLSLHKI